MVLMEAEEVALKVVPALLAQEYSKIHLGMTTSLISRPSIFHAM